MKFKQINHFFKTKSQTEAWLNEMNIKNYVIHPNLIVDVNETVTITQLRSGFIPIQFGTVNGDFIASNLGLKSLKGSPTSTYKVIINDNHLTSLQYCPKECSVIIANNNYLTSLKYAPEKLIGASFFKNNQLINLEDIPNRCPVIWLNGNEKMDLSTIKEVNYHRVFYINFSDIKNLKTLPQACINNTHFHLVFNDTQIDKLKELKPLSIDFSTRKEDQNTLRFKAQTLSQIIERQYLEKLTQINPVQTKKQKL